jgi:hypothetical protein
LLDPTFPLGASALLAGREAMTLILAMSLADLISDPPVSIRPCANVLLSISLELVWQSITRALVSANHGRLLLL